MRRASLAARLITLLSLCGIILAIPGVFAFWTYGGVSRFDTEEIPVKVDIITLNEYLPEIYIYNMEAVSTTGSNQTVFAYPETTSHTSFQAAKKGDTALYRITVYNRYTERYAYLATEWINTENISFALYTDQACSSVMTRKTELPAATVNPESGVKTEGSLTFYLKITASKSATPTTKLNFLFDRYEDVPNPDDTSTDVGSESAIDKALNAFEAILDDNSTGGKHKQLDDILTDGNVFAGLASGTFVGNVPGADDWAWINKYFAQALTNLGTLFGDLSTNIDGKEYAVYYLISKTNADGNSATGDANGNEYVIYMTTDPLSRGGSQAIVYATVFTSYDKNDWFEIGETYAGQSTVCEYNTGWTRLSGSFSTSSWKSTETYYGLASGASLNAILNQTATSELLNALQTQIQAADSIVNHPRYTTIYTQESRNNLETVLQLAKSIYASGSSATAATVETVTRALTDAIAALEDVV